MIIVEKLQMSLQAGELLAKDDQIEFVCQVVPEDEDEE